MAYGGEPSLIRSDPWKGYPKHHLDEFFDQHGNIRRLYQPFIPALALPPEQWNRRKGVADELFRHRGVTFALGQGAGRVERPIPQDIIPRLISAQHWKYLTRGLAQRLLALNLLVADIYGPQAIIKAGIIPDEFVFSSPLLKPRMIGVSVPKNRWISVAGIDVVRTGEDEYVVLEDNVRSPSGVSYVLENRLVSSTIWSDTMRELAIRSVVDYPQRLLDTFLSIVPEKWVVLTPGVYNSAYFEHSLLASQMGLDLVESRDLMVYRNRIHMRTTQGLKPIQGIYRRIDEDFLDPLAFRPDSLIGVPGLANVVVHGRVSLVNAIGCGIADDKGMYRFIPEAIKFFLGEDPVLPNIPTYLPWFPRERDYIFEHWTELVIKPVAEAGGHGVAFGAEMTGSETAELKNAIRRRPRDFIAQPVIRFSTAPVYHQGHFEPRYVDLRPFCLLGEEPWVLPGGLTRVSASPDSLVVNSSRGGAVKDTWVIRG